MGLGLVKSFSIFNLEEKKKRKRRREEVAIMSLRETLRL